MLPCCALIGLIYRADARCSVFHASAKYISGGKKYEKANDKNIINNDDNRNDIYNAAVNGIRRRNKGTDSKCI